MNSGTAFPEAAHSEEPAAAAPPSFADFALGVYPFLELQPFHRTYYRVLEAFAAGRIRRLIVTMPPQHGKSVGATTLLPAYLLGLDPDLRVAVASYSGSLASKFNRRVQRILESREYAAFFPGTAIKQGAKPAGYIRTADEVEIIGRRGGLLSVGREGSLTGNRVDCFVLDDLYKDALEANSPLVRANCWEWYTSVVRTRMHNASRELIVFTRWHEEDLIGTLAAREPVEELREWPQLESLPADRWLHLNFEALKSGPPTGIDPRQPGEALWEEQHGAALLAAKRRLDPLQFEAMYQGRPSSREGLLYGLNFAEYDDLPREIVRRQLHRHGRHGRRLPLLDLLRRRCRRGDLRHRCGLLARTDGDDRAAGGGGVSALRHAAGGRREQQRRPRIRPGRAGAGSGRPGRVVPPERQQGGSHPLQFGDGPAPPAVAPGVEPPLARAVRPSDDLPAEIPRQPLARRRRRCDGHHRARNRGPGPQAGPGRAVLPVRDG